MRADGSLTVLQVAYPLAPVSADAVGGAEQIVATLDEFLTRRGHRSLVAASADSRVVGTLLPTGVEERSFGSREKADVHDRHRRTVERAIRDYAPDIVHIHALEPERYASRQASTITTLHLPLDYYSREARALSNLVCVSESQRGALHAEVIPNGVPTCELRQHRRTVCVSLGRICPEKGFHYALRAARAAGVPMILAGEVFPYPEHQQYFRERLEPLLDRGRRFIGPVGRSAKVRLLARARCLLIPSLVAETSSLVAMEALMCGTPVIAFPVGALPEIVEHGRTGFLVANEREMARAIRDIEEIDTEVCRRVAIERFSSNAMCARYLELYRRLVKQGNADSMDRRHPDAA